MYGKIKIDESMPSYSNCLFPPFNRNINTIGEAKLFFLSDAKSDFKNT